MQDWWKKLSRQERLAVGSAICVLFSGGLALAGIVIPLLLILSIAAFLICGLPLLSSGDGSDAEPETDVSKLPPITTSTVSFRTTEAVLRGKLDALSRVIERGFSDKEAARLAEDVMASKLFDTGRRSYRARHAGRSFPLVICWTRKPEGNVDFGIEVSKQAVPEIRSALDLPPIPPEKQSL